jgi:hypothetical protein
VQLAGTGRIRYAGSRATLLLPLEPAYAYRMVVDLSGPPGSRTSIELNGVAVASCSPGEEKSCLVVAQPPADAAPVSALTFITVGPDGTPIGPRKLMFRGARVERDRR